MNKRILMVEDTEDNRQILRDLFAGTDYELIEAVDGAAGIAMAAIHKPDLILMDIQLPDMDGMAALKKLRADSDTRGMKVMAVSASVMPEDRSRILAAGFDGFQGKPIKLNEFLEAVAAMLVKSENH